MGGFQGGVQGSTGGVQWKFSARESFKCFDKIMEGGGGGKGGHETFG